VAGSDGRWYPAEAVIEGDSVVLSSRAVKEPLKARYDWKGYPDGNLYNREGLPALPFRSDEQSQPR
jgi:sialate O-acetylesterase